MAAVSSMMIVASVFGVWPLGLTEVLGFATGGVCVWLVVREHIWNWPLGLANNAVFFVLFHHAGLFADMGLQVIYFALGACGWWNWKSGSRDGFELKISRITRREKVGLPIFILLGTWGLRELLIAVSGAAPFWDSLTTVLSLAAQYLLCQKRLENWFLWIAADLIYVPLYYSRDLPLIALLYAVFLVMCLYGMRQWFTSWRPLAPCSDYA